MKYEIYQDRRGEWRWRFRAGNGKILAVSSEGYANRSQCSKCLVATKTSNKVLVIYL